MLAELGGDASLLSIEVAPPADGIQPALRTLPCLQLAEFFLTDATGQPVAFEWLGKLLGSPGGSELPPEGAAAAAAAAAEDAGAAATAAAAAAWQPVRTPPRCGALQRSSVVLVRAA